jgi:hypothetical protein
MICKKCEGKLKVRDPANSEQNFPPKSSLFFVIVIIGKIMSWKTLAVRERKGD